MCIFVFLIIPILITLRFQIRFIFKNYIIKDKLTENIYENRLYLLSSVVILSCYFLFSNYIYREIFFLGRTYDADEAFQMGMVNKVIKHEDLEIEALKWAAEINAKSPTAIRMLKFAFNLIDDGLVGQQLFAGEATRLAYSTEEASEGRDAFLQKRETDFSSFPYHY